MFRQVSDHRPLTSNERNAWEYSRRHFLGHTGVSLASAALASLGTVSALGSKVAKRNGDTGSSKRPHFQPRARRVIYLCQSGAPSQMDLYDYKPGLADRFGAELPDSVRRGQRLTGMTASQESFPIAPTQFKFQQWGQSGAWISELLPHTAGIADRLCFIRSMHTEAINHDPAITLMQTGSQLAGRPSFGAWLSYGLGSMNEDLPTFVALTSGSGGQPLYDRLWGGGFLPGKHQGVKFRRSGDPVLFLSNPPGVTREDRRGLLDDLASLNRLRLEKLGDPEIATRMTQYEMAYRMQLSVPELTDISDEPQSVLDLYGSDVAKPGTYAANCLIARRLAERGVRFIQLYHRGWDQHGNLPEAIRVQCQDTDRASAALVRDLASRGMLDDTLIIWAGEFGRTVYCQGTLTPENYGRDHHPRCFTIWLAGGGIKSGMTLGRTDDHSYNIDEDPVHVHDLNATLLHCLGIDHMGLTFKYQGRHHRLTDVHGKLVRQILA
ncbi:MAG: sulfatase [Planctomycetaceae bacterium]|nr:sulfatase [Planctomycetaceae bacterium]MBP60033.1 sulfatase [Planctomycetaceae bacterium]